MKQKSYQFSKEGYNQLQEDLRREQEVKEFKNKLIKRTIILSSIELLLIGGGIASLAMSNTTPTIDTFCRTVYENSVTLFNYWR